MFETMTMEMANTGNKEQIDRAAESVKKVATK